MSDTPTYHRVVSEQGIVPEDIYPRARALAEFNWLNVQPRRAPVAPPRVGVKPRRAKRTR